MEETAPVEPIKRLKRHSLLRSDGNVSRTEREGGVSELFHPSPRGTVTVRPFFRNGRLDICEKYSLVHQRGCIYDVLV